MACEECASLVSHEFRTADDLIHALRLAAEEANRGVLAPVPERGAPWVAEQEAIYSALYPQGGGLSEHGFTIARELILQEATADNIKSTLTRQSTLLTQDAVRQLPSLQEATLRWLGMYRRGRFELHVDTSDLTKEVNTIHRIAQQVILGIVLVGMIVGSAIAASFPVAEGTVSKSLAEWALIIFFISVSIAGLLVIALVYRLLWPRQED